MANKEFLNKGLFLDENWQDIHQPASTKHCAGQLVVCPVNLLAGNIYVDIRIKYAADDYKYLTRNRIVVVGGEIVMPVKMRYASAAGHILQARLKTAPQTATITGVTAANPGVITVDAMPAHAHDGALVDIASVGGMTEITDGRYIMNNITSTTFELQDEDGVDIDTSAYTAYTSGGTVELAVADASYDYYEETIPS